MNSYHYRLLPGSLCCLLALSAAGCASVPAQEMSDARQAIHAAQSAGAAQVVPGTLSEAQSRLKAAEEALRLHQFRDARREAEQANRRAREALRATEAQPKDGSISAPTQLPSPR